MGARRGPTTTMGRQALLARQPSTAVRIRFDRVELPGGDLSFQRVAPPVLWALGSFTTVFGKGTGGTTSLGTPAHLASLKTEQDLTYGE